MALLIYLVILVTVLVGFLIWNKIPRKFIFEIVHFTIWIFVLFAFVSLRFFDDKKTLIPFFFPIIPCYFFVHWSLRRTGNITK